MKTWFQRCSRELSGTVTKVKLVKKIKKLYQFYFGTLVLASYCYKMRTSFKTLASKKATTWHFKSLTVTINFHEK